MRLIFLSVPDQWDRHYTICRELVTHESRWPVVTDAPEDVIDTARQWAQVSVSTPDWPAQHTQAWVSPAHTTAASATVTAVGMWPHHLLLLVGQYSLNTTQRRPTEQCWSHNGRVLSFRPAAAPPARHAGDTVQKVVFFFFWRACGHCS